MTQLQHRQSPQQQQQQPGWNTLVGKTVFAQFGRFPFAVEGEQCVQGGYLKEQQSKGSKREQ